MLRKFNYNYLKFKRNLILRKKYPCYLLDKKI